MKRPGEHWRRGNGKIAPKLNKKAWLLRGDVAHLLFMWRTFVYNALKVVSVFTKNYDYYSFMFDFSVSMDPQNMFEGKVQLANKSLKSLRILFHRIPLLSTKSF